jgi:hypothetical protein
MARTKAAKSTAPKSSESKSSATLGFAAKLIKGEGDYAGANPEDPDDKFAGSGFGRPKGACRVRAMDGAHQYKAGKIVDDAMVAIKRDNPRLGELIDVIGPMIYAACRPPCVH